MTLTQLLRCDPDPSARYTKSHAQSMAHSGYVDGPMGVARARAYDGWSRI